ncbi:MAG: hypothetical protein M1401_08925 [Chloroflexi bacterium]|nr:hypothetical protein [Chloroflexota bacterium]
MSSQVVFSLDTRPLRLTKTALGAIALMLVLALGAYQGGWAMLTAAPGENPKDRRPVAGGPSTSWR